MKVMIVEDEMILSDAYSQVLKAANMEVMRAYNGQEALEMLSVEAPNVVLLDLRMPILDGIGFLKGLQMSRKVPDMKVIIFSNYDDQAEIDEAFSLGARHYILKSWASPDDLIRVVREVGLATQTA